MWEFTAFSERALLRRIVRRETVRLVVLTSIAVAAFFATRALAQRAEAIALRDAAEWYRRGQEDLAQGNPQDAATAFRRATMMRRGQRQYALALADALARSGNSEAAVRALLELREFSPEDSEVNLALARLARARDDLGEAVRYYHHAIYAPASDADTVRAIRMELIRMLLDAGEGSLAASELIAATVDLPDTPDARVLMGDLFREAGNSARALEQYRRVLSTQPRHAEALEGAVHAAFALGDYRQVASYRLPEAATAEAQTLVTIAREVLARDPLAGRLSAAERRRRLIRSLAYLDERWKACGKPSAGDTAADDDYPETLTELRTAARRSAMGRDTEQVEAAVATIDGLVREAEQRCGDTTAVDRALHIIAQRHGINVP